jgi:hypothetical protein
MRVRFGPGTEVRVDNGATFVKSEIYSGTGRMAEKANLFWSSLTDVSPAKRWYAKGINRPRSCENAC